MRRFRFAPSPNGYLHLGHAYSALLNAEMAAKAEGEFLLRIEDVDVARSRPEFVSGINEDLHWLGFDWPRPVRRQSEHFSLYRDAIQKLSAMGLVYASFESRTEIARMIVAKEADGTVWPRDPDGAPLYPGNAGTLPESERYKRMTAGEPFALRLDMKAALARAGFLTWEESGSGPAGEIGEIVADPALWGDVILARKEVPTSYHVSVVVDDALQAISDVVRGQDLFHATAVHVLLQKLLDLPQPRYHHHELLRDDGGQKLAKSAQSKTLRALRAEGVTAADLRRRLLPRS